MLSTHRVRPAGCPPLVRSRPSTGRLSEIRFLRRFRATQLHDGSYEVSPRLFLCAGCGGPSSSRKTSSARPSRRRGILPRPQRAKGSRQGSEHAAAAVRAFMTQLGRPAWVLGRCCRFPALPRQLPCYPAVHAMPIVPARRSASAPSQRVGESACLNGSETTSPRWASLDECGVAANAGGELTAHAGRTIASTLPVCQVILLRCSNRMIAGPADPERNRGMSLRTARYLPQLGPALRVPAPGHEKLRLVVAWRTAWQRLA